MNAWLIATVALLPPLAIPLVACARGPVSQRLAAVQLLTSIGTLLLYTLTFSLGQASSIDLAIALGLLGLPAGLLFAVALERWL